MNSNEIILNNNRIHIIDNMDDHVYPVVDSNGTINSIYNRDTCTTVSNKRLDIPETNNAEYNIATPTTTTISIFRYKFTQNFMDLLFDFSKIHQYDHRTHFKEAWCEWSKDNEEMIRMEINRLNQLNYEGDILDKMFKSARFYFRKKGTKKTEPQDRRTYISVNHPLLESIDSYICNNTHIKPSDGFIIFCNENRDLVKDEIKRMMSLGITDNLIHDKIKKTYKNRYFVFVQNRKVK